MPADLTRTFRTLVMTVSRLGAQTLRPSVITLGTQMSQNSERTNGGIQMSCSDINDETTAIINNFVTVLTMMEY